VELQTYAGRQIAPGPVTWVSDLSARVSQAISDAGTGRTMLLLAAVVAAAVASSTLIGRRR
jgi:hypothetical protein